MPSGRTVIRATILTALSLIVLRGIGGAFPQIKTIPVVGAVFQ